MSKPNFQSVKTREQLISSISFLRENLLKNPESWENKDLDSFLEALEGWLTDSPGYYKNNGDEISNQDPWSIVATALAAAAIYE